MCDTSLKMSDSMLSMCSILAPINNGYLEHHTNNLLSFSLTHVSPFHTSVQNLSTIQALNFSSCDILYFISSVAAVILNYVYGYVVKMKNFKPSYKISMRRSGGERRIKSFEFLSQHCVQFYYLGTYTT